MRPSSCYSRTACVRSSSSAALKLASRARSDKTMKQTMRYPVILVDPPVPYAGWTGHPVAEKYDLMTWDDLYNLAPYIKRIVARDCVLFLWTCPPLLIETIELVRRWGFQYKTKAFTWCKLYPTGSHFFVGMGFWTQANTEDVWLCTRGAPRRRTKDVAQMLATLEAHPGETPAVIARNVRHSQKPEAIQDRIERLLAGPYLELFARRQRPGWACLGNEVDGLDIRESLARLAHGDMPAALASAATEQTTLDLEAA